MKSPVFSTFSVAVLVAIFSFPLPASAQIGVGLKHCDRSAEDARAISKEVASCSVNSARWEDQALLARHAQSAQFIKHYSFKAFAADDPKLCAPLAAIYLEEHCREAVSSLTFLRAWIAEPSALPQACRRSEQILPGKYPWSASCCAKVSESRGRPDACGRLVPGCFADADTCQAIYGTLSTDASACKKIAVKPDANWLVQETNKMIRAEDVADCEAMALFTGAFRAKNIAVCGGAQKCRVLMGAGNEVAQEIDRKQFQSKIGAFVQNAAPTVSALANPQLQVNAAGAPMKIRCVPLKSEENRKVIDAAFIAAQTCISQVEAVITQPNDELIADLDARKEALARLRLQIDKHSDAALNAKSKTPAPVRR